MTTEEIKIMLTAAEDRLAQLQPEQEKLWEQYQSAEKELKKFEEPMKAARDAWHVIYNETNALKVLKTSYAAELAKVEGVAA